MSASIALDIATSFRRPDPGQLLIEKRKSAMIRQLLANGLGVKCHTDPVQFREFFRQAEGYDPASPLDVAFVDLDPSKFFCVQILDPKHRPIGICCGRVIDAQWYRGGLQSWLRRQRLFADRSPPLWAPDIIVEGEASRMQGRLGYVGGGWINPSWRNRGLIGFAVQLVHAQLVGHYRCDHLIGFVRPKLRGLALSEEGYGFRHETRAVSPYFAGTGYGEEMYFVYASRIEVMQRFSSTRGPQYHDYMPPGHEKSGQMRIVS
jgi:hypothetical protein